MKLHLKIQQISSQIQLINNHIDLNFFSDKIPNFDSIFFSK